MPGPQISSTTTLDSTPTGSGPGAGSPGGNTPTGTVDDLFLTGLREFSWKGISFPAVETDQDTRHDLVIHRMADRNGGYVENTGRHPVQITAEIPFLNHIYPAPYETWPAGSLYPFQWRKFFIASLETTSGNLEHPELGPLNCKLDRSNTRWRGSVRGGVIVHAVWVESDDDQVDQLEAFTDSSDNSTLLTSGAGLDANIATLEAALELQASPLPTFGFTFDQLANFIVGVLDIPTLVSKEFQGRVDNVIYQAGRVQAAIAADRVFLGPLGWPVFNDCERLKDAAYNVKFSPVQTSRPTRTTAIPKDMTMSQAALFCGATITDFLILNYLLVRTPVIPSGTVVTFYADAA